MCDIDEVPDFNQMYELYDKCTVMFFFRNKHMSTLLHIMRALVVDPYLPSPESRRKKERAKLTFGSSS